MAQKTAYSSCGDEMERLIPCSEMKKYSLAHIESPFFASATVENSLFRPMEISGLTDLIKACGSSIVDCLYEPDRARILEKVKCGDWLLVSDDPFSPLSEDCFGTYSHLTGKEFSLAGFSLRRTESKSEQVAEGSFLKLPEMLRPTQNKPKFESGSGKWVTKDIDYDSVNNTFAVIINRAGTLADEGRLIFSDGKDFANTTRTIVQEWIPLDDDERSFETHSAKHAYGAIRHIKQRFLEADDEWQVTGKSWHWVPATADTVYERKTGEK